jgi:membrane-associated phospholipid phosphatase
LIRRAVALAYVLALVLVVALDGVPTGRAQLMTIVIAGLGITCLGRGWRAFGQVLLDWLPFIGILVLYDLSRGAATSVGLPVHMRDIADLEKTIFGGTVPTVWLQAHFYSPNHVRWYDALATLIYTSHFLATPALAAVLWVRNRALWLGFAIRVVGLSLAALLTYVLFPEAPPWLAAQDHVIGPVARLSARGWEWLHLGNVHALLAQAQRAGPNPVAAMPSDHAALAALVALFIGAQLHSRWRWLLALYPLAMGLSLVYLGEHYVLDVLVGFGYALSVHGLACRWERRRAAARATDTAPESLSIQ